MSGTRCTLYPFLAFVNNCALLSFQIGASWDFDEHHGVGGRVSRAKKTLYIRSPFVDNAYALHWAGLHTSTHHHTRFPTLEIGGSRTVVT